MHERKQLMYDLVDGLIALPGGLGTLEELAGVATWSQLGLHAKPVVLLDVDGFWDPLTALLDRMVVTELLKPENRGLSQRTDSQDEVLRMLASAEPTYVEKWITSEQRWPWSASTRPRDRLLVGDEPRAADRLTAVAEAELDHSLVHDLREPSSLCHPVQPPKFVVLHTREADLQRRILCFRRWPGTHGMAIGAGAGAALGDQAVQMPQSRPSRWDTTQPRGRGGERHTRSAPSPKDE